MSLWAITAYFNPLHYRRRLENYRTFRRHLKVPLLAVEWSLDARWDLGVGDAEILIRKTSSDLLWQKERLLNLALGELPPECDAVAWLDADFVFREDDWAARVGDLLGRYALIQLFDELRHLPPQAQPGTPSSWLAGSRLHTEVGIGAQFQRAGDIDARWHKGSSSPVAPGMAWAARRELLESTGFYDACICGGGDSAMAYAAMGLQQRLVARRPLSAAQRDHYLDWADRFAREVSGRVGFRSGLGYHLWHGALANRNYHERFAVLAAFDFDPSKDIALTSTGCWRWNSHKPGLHGFLRRYFDQRREDGPPHTASQPHQASSLHRVRGET